jgi:hypothetical protein
MEKKTYHSYFLQVIHRSVWKRYHSKFSRIFTASKISQREKKQMRALFLPFLPHLPLSYILRDADRKFPMGEIARARIVTDEETEISK